MVSSTAPLPGKAKLFCAISAVPESGLTSSRHRVELFEDGKSENAWISEINILGDLPWHRGEEREVEVRIMSCEFRDYLMDKRPSLLVRYGSQIIGSLELGR
ncbi:hypothetical protein ACVBEJ_14390 [Porticoccus sp. GXU_MW_L64]